MSDLVVAVFATREGSIATTLESIQDSSDRDSVRVDPVVVTTAEGPRPHVDADLVELFPLGGGYAKTRVLEMATAPTVAFLDDTVRVGPSWAAGVLDALERSNTAAVAGPVRPYESDREGARAALAIRALRGEAHASNLVVVRDCALAVGGFDITLEQAAAPYEDLLLVTALRKRGWDARWVSAAAVESIGGNRGRVDPPSVRGREIGRAIRRGRGSLAKACGAAVVHHPGLASPTAFPGLLRGLRRPGRWPSPMSFLRRLPAQIAQRVDGEILPLPASPPPKTHLMYDVGGRLILHIHVAPSARLKRSLREREEIRIRTGELDGIPRLHGAQFDPDAAWILEDRLVGASPTPESVESWFTPVAAWAVRLAGPAGPVLGTVPEWHQHCSELITAFPEHEDALRRSLGMLDEVPSRHMHGDFQRRNLLVSGSSVGLVDWEGAWLHGIPGLDLVFLSLLAHSDQPDKTVLAGLLEHRDPAFGSLRCHLDRAGAPPSIVRPLLIAMLATWALGEDRRIHRSRTPSPERPYRELLDAFLPRAS